MSADLQRKEESYLALGVDIQLSEQCSVVTIIMSQEKHTSVESVLKLLRTITNRPEQPDRELRRKTQPPLRRLPTKASNWHDHNEGKLQRKRRIDENTVLKRILDGLEPTMEEFYNNKREPYEKIGKSSTTRLNIYLKQNQRILKTFMRKEEAQKKELTKMMVDYEEALEREYFFTVKDSYRDEIELFISKNRVSKQNYNTLEFNNVLVVLVEGQLKIYKDKTGSRLFKSIKLFEFENVEYNDQPFIFMVISFVKDKSKPLEYLYLKFHNQQSQQKWDRILYINWRLKDLKRKEYLFLSEYKEEQETMKIITDSKPYEVNVNEILKKLSSAADIAPELAITNQLPSEEPSSSDALNTPISGGTSSYLGGLQNKAGTIDPKPMNSDPIPEFGDQLEQLQKEPEHSIEKSKIGITEDNIVDAGGHLLSESMRRSKLGKTEEQPKGGVAIMDSEAMKNSKQENIKGTVPIVDNQGMKKPKLERIEEQLKGGVSIIKENRFNNSKKKLLPKSDGFEYVDLEKFENGTLKEGEAKKVFISQISKVLTNNGKLEVHYGQNKKMVMMSMPEGAEMNSASSGCFACQRRTKMVQSLSVRLETFKQWIKLKMIQ